MLTSILELGLLAKLAARYSSKKSLPVDWSGGDLFFFIVATCMTWFLFGLISNFLHFHYDLINRNLTTIETLESRRDGEMD